MGGEAGEVAQALRPGPAAPTPDAPAPDAPAPAHSSLWPRWLFLRALGLIYLSVFYSLAFQIDGLIGPRGLLPAADFLEAVSRAGPLRFFHVPTLLWLSASPAALGALWISGLAASLLLVFNLWPRAMLALCGLCFLSFVAAAQDFSGYQSDGMLLEATFLSLFLAPRGLRPGLGAADPPSRLAVFLLVWEWFRIYFESGVVKLLSGDLQWRSLTALDRYYENGPLPSWPGWYAQQLLPHWFHAGSVLVVFAFELGLVFFAFLPRRYRLACFLLVTPFQAAIILTANYAFLNYIVLFLGLLLLDDAFLARAGLRLPPPCAPRSRSRAAALLERIALGWVFAATILVAPGLSHRLPPALLAPARALEPFRVANRYGLFAVMTEERNEIELQGSNDGQHWTPYPFRYKPQDVRTAPGIYAPYQPRFEWNLWFAALGGFREYPWVISAAARLLEGSPPVLRLFARDPFDGHPPRLIRTVLWKYWFTTPSEKRRTGAWWNREERGLYGPTLERLSDGTIRIQDAQ